jgi:hypothetical protein
MDKFRSKPVVIEAAQWNETASMRRDLEGEGMDSSAWSGHVDKPDLCQGLRIRTLEGVMKVSLGDWIIKGVAGEFYPCKPDIFATKYEAVERRNSREAGRGNGY